MTPRSRALTDGWTLTGSGPALPSLLEGLVVPATVPGVAHTDLLRAGAIPDPFHGENERRLSWVGLTEWVYSRELEADPGTHERHELVFEGLDTFATVRLNGIPIAHTSNMHRTYRLDVSRELTSGTNALEVAFASPVREADAASLALGARPHVNHHPYNAVRRMACGFGWDWGIDAATAGIWRPVRWESWSVARIAELVVQADVRDGIPSAHLKIEIARTRASTAVVRACIGGVQVEVPIAADATTAEFDIVVPGAALWWPVGHGDPALHDLSVELVVDGEEVDRSHRRIGFRHVDVATEPDPDGGGTGFRIEVNGQLVLVRGANWIPDDVFPHRVGRDRYVAQLDEALYARLNLLRVWGGGIFESEAFYEECDARGILVWQDFLFACAAYSEEEPLASEVAAEAREAVIRLGTHPSLVVLNGNNENLWGRQEWGWEALLDGKTWGAGYYHEVLPQIVAEFAPQVAYTPGSPFHPDADARQNDPAHGTVHIWDVWNQLDYTHYRDYEPRFVAEFGWQGPPTWTTLVDALDDDPLTPESPGMVVHQKAAMGNQKLGRGLVLHLPIPDRMEDWHWAMSLNQAWAVRTGVEWFRSLTPHCTGSIIWQLNDCWPVTSWSALDGERRRKPMFFGLRAANAERLLTLQPVAGGGVRVAAVNDTGEAWSGTVSVERRGFDGRVLARSSYVVEADARSADSVQLGPEMEPEHPAAELLVATLDGVEARWYFAEARDSELAAAAPRVEATPTSDGWRIEVTADVLIRSLTLIIDRVHPDAVVDEALIDLSPGETAVFTVRGAVGADAAVFAQPDVLRSANDLVA